MNTYSSLPPEVCESTARGQRANSLLFDDAYVTEIETQLEEGLLDLPGVTIRFFDDSEGPCIETIENAHGYPIPRRKDYIGIPSKPNDLYQVRNVVTYYNSDDTIDIEVYIGWVDITSVEL